MTDAASNDEFERVVAFRVPGMDCAEEIALLRGALVPLVDEDSLTFDVLRRKLTVRLAPAATVTASDLIAQIASVGMRAEPWSLDAKSARTLNRDRVRVLLCALSGLLLAIGYLIHASDHGALHALSGHDSMAQFPVFSTVLFCMAILCGAWFVLPKAWGSLRRRRPDMNLLMVVAVIGAAAIGEWFEGAAVSFLFSFALLLESWSVDRARRAIEKLLDLSPTTVRLAGTDSGAAREVAVEDVAVGATFLVRPGERVPLDGVILEGITSIDEAPLTGESMPVPKEPGDDVFAGTINADAALTVRATRPASDSTLARIIHMVEDAQSRRSPSEQWVERFARRYTPIMMGLAILVAVVPPLLGLAAWGVSFYRALVLLVIACPCALVISTPVSIVAALATSARHGVLVKGGVFLEAMAHVRALAVDKTGTLTHGKPVVERVITFGAHTEAQVFAWALGIEEHSNHPLARAIVAYGHQQGIAASRASSVREIPGRGIDGEIDGRGIWVGGHRLAHERVQESEAAHASIAALEADGLTAVIVGEADHVCGVVGLADAVRDEARAIVQRLHDVGVERIVMLTGDHQAAADRVAAATGIDEVHASLLPEDKVREIEALNRSYTNTAMVGDGINDAPALATASIGIAMGAIGSDVAIETADIALMSDDLDRVPWLILHAKRTLRIVRQNVALALATKAAVVVLAALGSATLWMAIAADMGTSLLVIANALRLLRP